MPTSSETALPPSFEESLLALQNIVGDLEGGSITLDESLRRFEEGIGLLRQCYQFLERAELRIEQLVSLDAQGNCTLTPFDATATADKPVKSAAKTSGKKGGRTKDAVPPTPAVDIDTADTEPRDMSGNLLF